MPGLIPLCIFIVSLTFFSGGYFISSSFYFRKFDVKYSLKRMFPYEFNYPNAFKNNIYGNIAFLISISGIVVFYVYYLNTLPASNVAAFVLVIMAFIAAVATCCLLFMPLQFLRMHMMISTIGMVVAFALPAMACSIIFPSYRDSLEHKVVYLVAFIIGAIMAVAMLILLLNPRATYKIYMEKDKNPDGTERAVRPRFIPIAFNEWWAIITFILSPIPLLITSFIA